MEWRKSSYCGTDHVTEQCIEVAEIEDANALLMRTTDRSAPYLLVTRDELAAFVAGAKAGEFDDLA